MKKQSPRHPRHGKCEKSAPRLPFPIVGIGASAGGLEAFMHLLKSLPVDTGLGFVLVQHLDPQYESALTRLLARATSMPVREITDNLLVMPNHVYVIPRNRNLLIMGGRLNLRPRRQDRTPQHSIDAFFESLAQDQRERAIGVILSGTATDGTAGLEAIKAEGGITFAQDGSAKYDSMPRSAIAAGCVDFVLAPDAISKELVRLAKHPYVAGEFPDSTVPEDERASATAPEDDATPLTSGGRGAHSAGVKGRDAVVEDAPAGAGARRFKKILLLLRNHSGVDFSLYKSTTIQRRIVRRMVLGKHASLEQYADFLRENSKELDALYSDALISVTSFFRNLDAFELLKRKVFPKLLQQRSDAPVRVWVLGCSTGQEAYSIAMTFMESSEAASRMRKLQVFATDLNEALLDKARHGLYAKSLSQDVSPERLRRFFVEEEGGYRVTKPLREMVVFARQNVISDPPFSRMDLISCRNLLIYLESTVQRKAMSTFHYALKPQGFLFLGASESIGSFTELFEPIDKKHKLYVKKATTTPAFHLPMNKERGAAPLHAAPLPMGKPQGTHDGLSRELNAQLEADRVTVNRFSPPGVMINVEMQILQFRGPTGRYLQPPTGKASLDVLKMAREGLMLPLRAAINKSKKDNGPVRKEQIRVQRNGTARMVNVEVIPLKNLQERCFLILFEDADKGGRSPGERRAPRAVDFSMSRKQAPRRVHALESELAETRDYLQSIQEQHQVANEEFQAANEEVQSTNEELQSINEELETSKEELESSNEELTTVNEEMSNRNQELSRLNADLTNLQASTSLPLLLIGRDLTIRRFSSLAEKLFNLLAVDVGRSLSGIRHNLVAPESTTRYPIEALVRDVIDNVRAQEQEVLDIEGRWYTLRVHPYLTHDRKVDGAMVVLVDITDVKHRARDIEAARNYAEAIIRTVRDPLMILRTDLRVNTANEAFYKAFNVMPDQTEGRLIYELGNRQWNIPKLRELLNDILLRCSVFSDFEVTHDFPDIGRRTMLLNARRLEQEDGSPGLILLAIEDVTERKRSEEALRGLNDKLEQRVFELAHSQDRLRALATELNLAEQRERKRLATELHDHLQQILVLGKIKLSQGKRLAKAAPAAAKVMKDTDDLLSEALSYTRTLVSDFSPTVLRDHGLPTALQWLGTYMQKHNQLVTVTVPDDADLKLPEDQVILLFQFVRELLINSAKHAGTGEATVRMEQRDGLLRIEVRDEGAGFDLAAAATARTPTGGISSKFGLFSIRERMGALGGSFDLKSAPGQGTMATLTLPVQPRDERETRDMRDEQHAISMPVSPLSPVPPVSQRAPIRVLLVDDHPLMREGLRSIVTGYHHLEIVGEAEDGTEAVELAQRLDPDVVVMDINMPKMDGIEATRRIKAHRASTVVIGLSVNQSAETVEKMKAAGAAAYLTKESAADALYQTIDAAILHKRGAAQGGSS